MRFLKNYKSMIVLFLFIVLGTIVGLIWEEDALVLKPLGDLFLNMLLVVIVPLIFLSISMSIYRMKQPKRMGKILVTTFLVFFATSVVAVLIGVVSAYSFKLVDVNNGVAIKEGLGINGEEEFVVSLNVLEKIVEMTSVDDFSKLLSRDNMIALIVMSILVGFAMHMSGERAEPVYKFMDSCNEIVNNLIKIIMCYAPFWIRVLFCIFSWNFWL